MLTPNGFWMDLIELSKQKIEWGSSQTHAEKNAEENQSNEIVELSHFIHAQ